MCKNNNYDLFMEKGNSILTKNFFPFLSKKTVLGHLVLYLLMFFMVFWIWPTTALRVFSNLVLYVKSSVLHQLSNAPNIFVNQTQVPKLQTKFNCCRKFRYIKGINFRVQNFSRVLIFANWSIVEFAGINFRKFSRISNFITFRGY